MLLTLKQFLLLAVALAVSLGVMASANWEESKLSPSFCSVGGPNGQLACLPPLNTSGTLQERKGPLTINDSPLTLTSGDLVFKGRMVGVGPNFGFPGITALDDGGDNVRLDVDGQIRIRGGGIGPNKIASSSPGSSSVVVWADLPPAGISDAELSDGEGIKYTYVPSTNRGTLEVDYSVIQATINQGCANNYSVAYGVNSTNPNQLDCRSVITGVTNNGGLLIGTGSGTRSVQINSGNGIFADGNGVKIAAPSFPFQFTGGVLKFTDGSTAVPYFKWDGANWVQAGLDPATNKPGGNIFQIRVAKAFSLPVCPIGWSQLGDDGVEYVGPDNTYYNKVRTCQRADANLCQVLELKSSSPPACPSGWDTYDTTASHSYSASTAWNNMRYCLRCVAP